MSHRVFYTLVVFALASIALSVSSSASGQEGENDLPVLHIPKAESSLGQNQETARQILPYSATVLNWALVEDDPGKICTTIDFEGVGNLTSIPEFDGITSPGWLGIIDADAGGTGNIAFEPSPSTIAFWLEGDPTSRYINFAEPVSEISFFYASAVNIQLQAFDASGNTVATISGSANWNQGPGGDPNGTYNKWDLLTLQVDANEITSVKVYGNENQTGIDDLKVCKSLKIHSVEFTQAIQEWQTLEDLQSDLSGDQTPPVPIVAGKPVALRVYMEEVKTVTQVRVQISGVASQEKTITLQPNCTPEQSRRQENNCSSADFFFTPPTGNWTVTVKTFDKNNNEVESQDFSLRSEESDPLILRAVPVCDAQDTSNNWQCSSANVLGTLIGILRKIAPTHDVHVTYPGHQVRRNTSDYDADGDGTVSSTEMYDWWSDVVADISGLGTEFYYYGMVRQNVPGGVGGMAGGIPSNAAASRTSVVRLGTETNDEVVAHETGHALGRRHTNTNQPTASSSPPGCYSFARDGSTDWPYADNTIQSGPATSPILEVGFDVAERRAIVPDNTYEIMSYCVPRWISPISYRGMLGILNPPTSRNLLANATTSGTFWLISGKIFDDQIDFDPIFTVETIGDTEPGSGSYRIEIRDNSEIVLFTRFFTPTLFSIESITDTEMSPTFFEVVPVQASATHIILFGPTGIELGQIALGGAIPTVDIIFPAGGETLYSSQAITWSVNDSDSDSHVFKVQYSTDGGSVWRNLASHFNEASMVINFGEIPGSDGDFVIRVLASDGTNTGFAESNPFTVPKKIPTAGILFPTENSAFQSGDLVWLQGIGFDVDDGSLEDNLLEWESNIDGFLGYGDDLSITSLSDGIHIITFRVTDSDGNTVSDTVTILVDSVPPTLNLSVVPDGTPAYCVDVTIEAFDQTGGSGLELVEYSLDGGQVWHQILLDELPYNFVAPGWGYFHLVVHSIDRSGNLTASDQKFFTAGLCQAIVKRIYLPLVVRNLGDLGIDKYEPDKIPSQASQIFNNTPQNHSILPEDDVDWVTFSLGTASQILLETSGPSGDTRMWLYDSNLSKVDFDDDSGSGLFSQISRQCSVDSLPAGIYYVKVDEYGYNSEIPSYQILLTTNSCQ